MCRTNGLKKLYERELTMQSKYYAVLDALLRNFREAEAAEELNINTADLQRMGKLILTDEELYKDFRADMVPIISATCLASRSTRRRSLRSTIRSYAV